MTKEQLDQFETFWRTYPRRIGKGAARSKFERALKITSFEEIMAGIRRQLAYYASREQQFIPHPATWLNQERWSDEPQPPANNNHRRTIRDAARDLEASFDYRGDALGFPSIGRH
ncbi:hypothetical protein ABCW43_00205 [Neorhizobium sp. IRAMC:178]|uniref:hypothetical protein n=1 Tax=Neorhizobium tunisiense TaxID=3144793 RepID=UPI0031F64F12